MSKYHKTVTDISAIDAKQMRREYDAVKAEPNNSLEDAIERAINASDPEEFVKTGFALYHHVDAAKIPKNALILHNGMALGVISRLLDQQRAVSDHIERMNTLMTEALDRTDK